MHLPIFLQLFIHLRIFNTTAIIKDAFAIIENRFNRKIVFFCSEGEKSLRIEYSEFIASKGIIYKLSAPDT